MPRPHRFASRRWKRYRANKPTQSRIQALNSVFLPRKCTTMAFLSSLPGINGWDVGLIRTITHSDKNSLITVLPPFGTVNNKLYIFNARAKLEISNRKVWPAEYQLYKVKLHRDVPSCTTWPNLTVFLNTGLVNGASLANNELTAYDIATVITYAKLKLVARRTIGPGKKHTFFAKLPNFTYNHTVQGGSSGADAALLMNKGEIAWMIISRGCYGGDATAAGKVCTMQGELDVVGITTFHWQAMPNDHYQLNSLNTYDTVTGANSVCIQNPEAAFVGGATRVNSGAAITGQFTAVGSGF